MDAHIARVAREQRAIGRREVERMADEVLARWGLDGPAIRRQEQRDHLRDAVHQAWETIGRALLPAVALMAEAWEGWLPKVEQWRRAAAPTVGEQLDDLIAESGPRLSLPDRGLLNGQLLTMGRVE